MDDGALRQILADHRRELGLLLEHWTARQELSVVQAIGTCTSGNHTNSAFPAAPQISAEAGDELGPNRPDVGVLASSEGLVQADSGGTRPDLPSEGSPSPGGRKGSRGTSILMGFTSSSKQRAVEAAMGGGKLRMDDPESFVHRQADHAHHDLEEKVESMCPRLDMMGRIVSHVAFEAVISCTLLLNVAVIGLRVEHQAWSIRGDDGMVAPGSWRIIEYTFIVVYTFELMIRLLAFRVKFFTGEDASWNMFDMFLVVTSIAELFQDSNNTSNLRLWRILKLAKILRIVRLASFCRELRLMLASILGSMKALVWSLILIAGTTYMVAVAFVLCTMDFLESSDLTLAGNGERSTSFVDVDGVTHEVLAFEYFRSVFSGAQTLFSSVTGGMDWLPVSDALWQLSALYFFFFYAYICFFNFVIMNTVTSLFLDGVMNHTENDKSLFVREMLKQKKKFIVSLHHVHHHMCSNGGTEATLDQFQQHLTDPEMIKFARTLEVDLVDLQVVFDVLSNGGQQSVDLESFVVGCIRLRGSAKSVDLISLSIAQKKLASACERQFADLRRLTSAIAAAPVLLEAPTESAHASECAVGSENRSDLDTAGAFSMKVDL